MEVVRQFSDEMNTILEGKLPVSRARMASITKLALKAMKYYKHIVMTVEKFVAKCASEYKVPGLYVIDSIVRQSRHQVGPDKDNFGPRFSKSFEKTFLHLFTCPPEDKAKIIRVLNLWQKNGVFPPDVIQPLLALAPSPEHTPGDSQPLPREIPPVSQTTTSGGGQTSQDLDSANQIIQRQQSQIQALLQQQQQLQTQASTLLGPALQGLLVQASDNPDLAALLKQSQELAAAKELVESQKANGDSPPPAQMSNNLSVHSNRDQHTEFNTALLDDFDYSDDEDIAPTTRKTIQETRTQDSEAKDSTDHLLEELQEQFRRQEAARAEQPPPPKPPQQVPPPLPQHYPPPRSAPRPPPVPSHPFPPPNMPLPPHMNAPHPPRPPLPPIDYNHRGPPLPSQPPHFPPHRSPPSSYGRRGGYRSPPGPPPMRGRRRSPSPVRRGSWRDREREWDRDRRSPWRRSRSPPFRDRNHSRSRTPPFRSPRRRSDDTERPRRASITNKEKHVTVLSTTIWMGHLAKSVGKEQIRDACSEHGLVQSVDVVSARGCAYIVMETRPNAIKVLNALKDVKLNGSMCKLAWAPGRGVKGGTYRSYWNLDDGASIIPWEAIQSQSELDKLVDGGWIEPSTCPPGMKPPLPPKSEPPPFSPVMPPGQPLFPPPGMPPQSMPPQGMPLQPPQGMPPRPPVPIGAPQPMFSHPPVSGGPQFPPNTTHLPPLPPNSSDTTVDMQIASSPPVNSEV